MDGFTDPSSQQCNGQTKQTNCKLKLPVILDNQGCVAIELLLVLLDILLLIDAAGPEDGQRLSVEIILKDTPKSRWELLQFARQAVETLGAGVSVEIDIEPASDKANVKSEHLQLKF